MWSLNRDRWGAADFRRSQDWIIPKMYVPLLLTAGSIDNTIPAP